MSAARSDGRVTVIGAGLAGLAAAVALTRKGIGVDVLDAAAQAGGRCRSYFDPQLETVIDNGNHLVMSGNHAIYAYLDTIGSSDRLEGPQTAAFDFIDLPTKERWTVRPNAGPIPWWVLTRARRAPRTRVREYLGLARLLRPAPGARVDETIDCRGPLWRELMQPFLLAALNTRPEDGSAALAGAVVRETLAKGGDAYRPRIATPTLAAAFVDPAIAFIRQGGGTVTLGARLRRLDLTQGLVSGLVFADRRTPVTPDNAVILAVPPWDAQMLLPGLSAPDAFCSIVNGHFKVAPPAGHPPILGVIGGVVEWIFCFPDRISITVSNADHLGELSREALAQQLWSDVAAVYDLDGALPPWQVVREKRATFAATVEQDRKRPTARTEWANLHLAGDWVQTGLPATIEGAVRSGFTAADLVIANRPL